jgi:cobalt-zinc-cadmium efflux system protein
VHEPANGHWHEHHHSHGAADTRALGFALGLIVSFMIAEVVAGVFSHSLALIADAAHMLTDAAAIGAAAVAARLALRPATGAWTFGYKRAEVLSAQANGISLLIAAVLIAIEAVRRLLHPAHVQGLTLIVVAVLGVAVNVVASRVVSHGAERSLNVEGVYRHLLTDTAAFAGTLIAGIIIATTHFRRADSIAALAVVGLMLYTAARLLAKTGRVLLEAAPEGVAPRAIVDDILSDDRVASVHDVHVWLITSGFPALAAHVLVEESADCHGVRRDLEQMLSSRHGIDHTTLQVDHAAEHLLSIEQRPTS